MVSPSSSRMFERRPPGAPTLDGLLLEENSLIKEVVLGVRYVPSFYLIAFLTIFC